MSQLFNSHIMVSGEARFAYPIVRLTFPDVTLSQWLYFARAAIRQSRKRGGLIALRDLRDHTHALFRYRVEHDLPLLAILKVSTIVVGRLPGQALEAALIESFDSLARQNGCQAICLELATGDRLGERGKALQLSGYLPYGELVLRAATIS
jgi:hypothetical protein